MSNSTVTAQEVDASLNQTSTGKQYTYATSSDLGTFLVTSTFFSPYIELSATGKYFDEVANATSTGPITLKGWNASSDTDLNVNILTTLAHQRIKTLMTRNAPLSFAAARQQAEQEVLAAFYIRDYNQVSFSSLNLSKSRDADNILAAISSLFLFGNTYGQVSALMASFQADIADNGVVDNTATQAALINSANSVIGINPATVASNLTSKYSSAGRSWLASDISNWLDQDGDKVIGKFKFQGVQALAGTPFTFPVYTAGLSDNGATYSIANGSFRVNGGVSVASATVHTGDSIVVTRTPVAHESSSVFLQSNLPGRVIPPTPTINVARYDFNPFAAAGSLTTPRTNLTATVLQNGQVLATGGLVAGGTTPAATDSAELYNPVTNQWTSASSMKVKRVGHTATLLNNGQVLVVGGDAAGAAGTAELYDPTTNTWTKMAASAPTIASSPAYGHIYHTATLLSDGRVLIVGGITYSLISKSSTGSTSPELYNPATGLWTTLSNMNTSGLRYNHTATLLPNNKVLIAGGINGNIAIASAELFDPIATAPANSWTSVSAGMFDARYSHSATLLQSGKVLFTGGLGSAGTALAGAELFDPAVTTNPWAKTSPLKTGRFAHIAQQLSDGKVLVAGGSVNSNGAYLSSAELYDQTTGLWAPNGNLSYARDAFGAVMLNSGKVLMAGGNGVKAAETFK